MRNTSFILNDFTEGKDLLIAAGFADMHEQDRCCYESVAVEQLNAVYEITILLH
jgi:hypothetical protein